VDLCRAFHFHIQVRRVVIRKPRSSPALPEDTNTPWKDLLAQPEAKNRTSITSRNINFRPATLGKAKRGKIWNTRTNPSATRTIYRFRTPILPFSRTEHPKNRVRKHKVKLYNKKIRDKKQYITTVGGWTETSWTCHISPGWWKWLSYNSCPQTGKNMASVRVSQPTMHGCAVVTSNYPLSCAVQGQCYNAWF
jgi:hypothetical protein